MWKMFYAEITSCFSSENSHQVEAFLMSRMWKMFYLLFLVNDQKAVFVLLTSGLRPFSPISEFLNLVNLPTSYVPLGHFPNCPHSSHILVNPFRNDGHWCRNVRVSF
ncbi:hypothetical protein GDO81_018465 [Engystomops pustulosus]|uniref:Uncharacterized protein n=1 Tax=Engystomops pustulosus TaxID=76066 RepID=A0AAV6ZUD9_ENGPU|nr:hypothetical protein GDO81_018465 [Engystomops pustulosus]